MKLETCIFIKFFQSFTTRLFGIFEEDSWYFSKLFYYLFKSIEYVQTVPGKSGLSKYYESPDLAGTVCILSDHGFL